MVPKETDIWRSCTVQGLGQTLSGIFGFEFCKDQPGHCMEHGLSRPRMSAALQVVIDKIKTDGNLMNECSGP